jgi:hypothetical protein
MAIQGQNIPMERATNFDRLVDKAMNFLEGQFSAREGTHHTPPTFGSEIEC